MNTSAYERIPTSTPQAKRLALLHGPDRQWKAPMFYGLSYAGRFDRGRLETTLRLLARRHSAFRTFFLPERSTDAAGCVPPDEASWPLRFMEIGEDHAIAAAEQEAAYTWLSGDFDPGDRPLVRALLLRRPGDDLLGLAIDHCLADGFSAAVMFKDFIRVYTGLRTEPAETYDVSVSDAARFARDERAWLAGEKGAAALEFWDKLTAGLEAYPRLGIAQNAPFGRDAPLANHWVAFSAADMSAIRSHMKRHRLSSFMFAATAVATSVRGCTDSDDIAFMFSCARRTWPSTWDLVAYAANRAMIRLDVSREDTVASLAGRMRAHAVEAIHHSMLCHEEFIRLRFPDSYARPPAVAYLSLNVMEQGPLPPLDGHPLNWERLPFRSRGYNTPGIGVNFYLEGNESGTLHLFHPQDMYDPGLAEGLAHSIAEVCLTG
jgi:hypothetical protein